MYVRTRYSWRLNTEKHIFANLTSVHIKHSSKNSRLCRNNLIQKSGRPTKCNSILNEVFKTSPRIRQTSPFTISAFESVNSKAWWTYAFTDFVNMNLQVRFTSRKTRNLVSLLTYTSGCIQYKLNMISWSTCVEWFR